MHSTVKKKHKKVMKTFCTYSHTLIKKSKEIRKIVTWSKTDISTIEI